jgi:hypothetical protein
MEKRAIDSLDWIHHKASMGVLFFKIKYSLEEIQQKRPDRLDYITSMESSLLVVGETLEFISTIEKTQIIMSREISRMHLEIMQLKSRISKLEEVNQKLFENATL